MSRKMNFNVIGDANVGKSSLLFAYTTDRAPPDIGVPTLVNFYRCNRTLKEREYKLQLWDTAGQKEHKRQRFYTETDCFLLCYAVDDQDSYDGVFEWHREIRLHQRKVPIVLIATKTDLRGSINTISTTRGRLLQLLIGAAKYVECSAKNLVGVNNVFDEAIKAVLKHSPPSQEKEAYGRCVLV